MVLLVVTEASAEERVVAELARLEVPVLDVLAPGGVRRLVRARLEDEREAGRSAARLRERGLVAVTRPEGGGAFDAWMRHTAPLVFGDRLGLCFAWSEHPRPDVAALVEIGPGGWGGEHPSTRLVVEQLVERIEGGEHVLDVGCGSGVLGLCALALGAHRVVAVDIKPSAVEATARNAELNGVTACLEATGAPVDAIDDRFEVVVANVGMTGVATLAGSLTARVSPGGWLAVSGISPSQCEAVAGYLHPLAEIDRRTSAEWAALVLQRVAEEVERG